MPSRGVAVLALAMLICPGAWGQRFSLAVGGGAGPAAGSARVDAADRDARPEIGGTLLVNAGVEVLRVGGTRLTLEIPFAFHGSQSSDVFTSGMYAGFYRERVSAVLTPGVRVQFRPEQRISPWLSFGAGPASIRRTGTDFQGGTQLAAQRDSNLSFAMAPAAGADVRLSRAWFLRGELRNYVFKTPGSGFVSAFPFLNRWNYNPVAAASLGFRLR